jgi:hypothetical protein
MNKKLERVDRVDIRKGGIYIETNDDPRGWVFGDKSRKLYTMKIADTIKMLDLITGLSLDIKTTPCGGAVNVVVKNPENVDRMLLSHNDDVGSSIQYADISSPLVQLTANPGTHICIEPFSTRQSIRVHIYPGSNTPDITPE